MNNCLQGRNSTLSPHKIIPGLSGLYCKWCGKTRQQLMRKPVKVTGTHIPFSKYERRSHGAQL